MKADFEALNIVDRKELLCKFLQEYGAWSFEDREKMFKVIRFKNIDYMLSWKECAQYALTMIEVNHIHALKFEYMVQEMKKHGMGDMYHFIMHQKIEDAIVK